MGCSFKRHKELIIDFKTQLDQSGRKPKKILVGKGTEFYNKSIKS